MKLRWLLFDHFPPGIDLSPDVRAAVRKLARLHRFIEPRFMNARLNGVRFMLIWIVVLSLGYAAWSLLPLFSKLIPQGTPLHLISHIGSMLLFQALLWIIIALGSRRSSAPYYRQALCDLGYPVCLNCGYLLRGLSNKPNCPECGSTLQWRSDASSTAHGAQPTTHPS